MDNKKIGRYLFKKRKEEGKTQKEVAEELGVTYQAVSRWENGDSIPDIETLCMIADLYHVTVDEILQRDHIETPNNDMIILSFITVFIYVIALLIFLVINTIWIPLVGLALYIIFAMTGMIPVNAVYLTELDVKTKRDKILYILSYVPLIISVIVVILTY